MTDYITCQHCGHGQWIEFEDGDLGWQCPICGKVDLLPGMPSEDLALLMDLQAGEVLAQ